MYNKDLLQLMITKYGVEKVLDFSQMVSYMFNCLAENADEVEISSEYKYERDWWANVNEQFKLKNIETCKNY